MDKRQKLWFGSNNYPLEYVNTVKITAVDSVASIDNGRGCQLNYSAGGYQIRHYVRALPGQRVISHIVEATNISGTTKQLNWSLGGDTWFSGSPVQPGEVEETTPVKPNEPDAQQGQAAAPSPKPLPPVKADTSVDTSVLAKTGVAAVPAIVSLSLLLVMLGWLLLTKQPVDFRKP